MTKVRLWTIIGESDVGKSTSVKTLVSRLRGGNSGFSDVLLRGGGYFPLIGKAMAWQESEKSPEDSVRKIEAFTKSGNRALGGRPPAFTNILSTLRFDPIAKPGKPTFPAATAYLDRWITEGWELKSLVLMSPDPSGAHDFYGYYGAPTLWHYESSEQSVGNMVGSIRNHFGWA